MSTDDEQAQSTQQYVLEAMLFSVGPVTALIAARCGLRSWLKYEAFYSFLIGIVLFFKPSWILSIIVTTYIFLRFLLLLYVLKMSYENM